MINNILQQQHVNLVEIENQMLDAPSQFTGSWEHWTLTDTIFHTNSWKSFALNKVKQRLEGKSSPYHGTQPLDEINRTIYDNTGSDKKENVRKLIHDVGILTEEVLEKISGKEDSNEYAPSGFGGSVQDYLFHDLIVHPVKHYLYYCIRNDDLALFGKIEDYIDSQNGILPEKENIIDLKIFFPENKNTTLFDKTGSWAKNALFQKIRNISQQW